MRAKLHLHAGLIFLTLIVPAAAGPPELPLDTTIDNFYHRGTQPGGLTNLIQPSSNCRNCHDTSESIYMGWVGSLMGQTGRDPLTYACLDIAEADAPGIGDTCLRCHAPKAWLEGRSTPTDGSALTTTDRDGVNCNVCHRLVDPFSYPGAPSPDSAILAALGADAPIQSMDLGMPSMPGDGGNAGYVIDPQDRRRGPFPLPAIPGTAVPPEVDCDVYHPTMTFESDFHRRSDLCATCHDVSPPHFHPDGMGGLVFNGMGNAHPSGNKYEMVPEQRTYSEWLNSSFADGGVAMGGRFGGPGQSIIEDCQDCHMPKSTGTICTFIGTERDDVGQHFFAGAGTWVLDAIKRHYGVSGSNPSPEIFAAEEDAIDAAIVRNRKMLKCAADLEVFLDDSQTPGVNQLLVRVTNQTGHKLPTGYPEGRRMFLTVQYFDCTDYETPFQELGGYDPVENELDEETTKVYEVSLGMDDALATSLNRAAGPSFHLAFANKTYKDNRIPPAGFTNANFTAIQAAPVDYAYADGQYWDDTFFTIPAYAIGVKVTLYYETAKREYVEFLYNNNPDFGTPGNRGETLYNLWDNGGNRPQPQVMAVFPPNIESVDDGEPPCTLSDVDLLEFDPNGDGLFNIELKGDVDGSRSVTTNDIPDFVSVLLGQAVDPRMICAADMNYSDTADGLDIEPFVFALVGP